MSRGGMRDFYLIKIRDIMLEGEDDYGRNACISYIAADNDCCTCF